MKHLLIALLFPIAIHAQSIDFLEQFANPSTRPTALETLTPGTRDYYFHTALHQQLTNQTEAYNRTIAAWQTAANRTQNPISSDGLQTLENRQILISYETNPKAALTELKETLNLRFEASKPDSAPDSQNTPNTLDPALISTAAFLNKIQQTSRTPYQHFSSTTLYRELDNLSSFDASKTRWFIDNFTAHQHPKYNRLLQKALTLSPPVEITQIPLHMLTLEQMKTLANSPALTNSEPFHRSFLKKLAPIHPQNIERDLPAHAAFLARCAAHVTRLPPALNSLRAHILYHHLRLQEKLGDYPETDFYTYLTLPRPAHEFIIQTRQSQFHPNPEDFSVITSCPPVHDDSQLVNRYLLHILSHEKSPNTTLRKYIKKDRLARLHAEAQLLTGADPAPFAEILGQAQFQALLQEVRISIPASAREIFPPSADVKIPLVLKNTPELQINIYQIASADATVTTNLDGLVPHHQRTLKFTQKPILLHRTEIALPELAGPGTWLVEFISGRTSARALIKKGNLTPYITRAPAGHSIRAFDYSGTPVNQFNLTLGSETFSTENGEIIVPNSPNQAPLSGTLTTENLTAEISLTPRENNYDLQLKTFVPREQLLANQTATVQLRTQLTNHGLPIPLNSIKNPTLTLRTNLLGEISAERTIADPLNLTEIIQTSFLVPADLLSFTLTLHGTIPTANPAEPIELSATSTHHLNGALTTTNIASAYFSPTSNGHQLHLLGRNGEPLPNHVVNLRFTHSDFKETLTHPLRTNSSGTITLGTLENITTVTATSPAITPASYTPPTPQLTLPTSYNIPTTHTLEIPHLPTPAGPTLLSLTPSGTVKSSLPITFSQDKTQLILTSLPPGNYQLHHPSPSTELIEIKVLPSSAPKSDLLTSPNHITPRLIPSTPTLTSTEIRGESLHIRLKNPSPETSVTIVGKRFATHNWHPGTAPLPFQPYIHPSLTRPIRPSSYLTGRMLSDEMRYIINRRSAEKFPGSMLPHPGHLLYRWTPRSLKQNTTTGTEGTRGTNQGTLREGGASTNPMPGPATGETPTPGHPSYLDFLQNPSTTKFNLPPNPDGTLTIPLADFPNAQFLEIIAATPLAANTRHLLLPPREIELRDRRLTRPLPPKKHYLPTRTAVALSPTQEVSIQTLLGADYRTFTTLREAYQFLLNHTHSSSLRTFAPLTKWPSLTEPEKLNFLAQNHCHEVHLFLSRKDPDFFAATVAPYLEARPNPTFIDDYLLKKNLEKYTRPYAFSRLNAAEKALLAQALPAQQKTIHNELKIRWKSEAPSPQDQTNLFTQTLKGTDPESYGTGLGHITPGTPHPQPSTRERSEGKAILSADAFALSDPDPFADSPSDPAPPIFPSRTKLYLPANYYQHSSETDETLIPLNHFWLDLALADNTRPFTSPHFNACTHSTADALMCLALLDLPFTAEKPITEVSGSTLKITASSRMLLFYKDTLETENIAPGSPLLVRQSYHPLHSPFLTDSANRPVENSITGPFQTGTPYGISYIITNPTGTTRHIETLAQIPAGAIPLASQQHPETPIRILPAPHQNMLSLHAPKTLSTSHNLPAYGVIQLNLAFYFPSPGTFTAYPLHVSENDQILAHTEPKTLTATTEPPTLPNDSWPAIARNATPGKVLETLKTENLTPAKINAILWRFNDPGFYQKAIEIIHSRLINAPRAFSYSILHNDPKTLAHYIETTPLVKNLGKWFSTPLIQITPTEHHDWETLEFDPLINPRTHPFANSPHLTHQLAQAHYRDYLQTLIWKPALTSQDHLTLTYFLLLQDRIAKALETFEKINPKTLPHPLQYDYLHATVLFYQAKPQLAKIIADPHATSLPPGLWKDRFQSIVNQAQEISTPLPTTSQTTPTTNTPALTITPLPDNQIMLEHTALPGTTLSLYNIDLEVLFSTDPFLQNGLETSLPPIAPNHKIKIKFEKNTTQTTYQLPPKLHQGNLLIAADSKQTKTLKILDSQLIKTHLNPQTRTIQVIDPLLNQPLPKTYIKVYAQDQNGVISFYKDGYTDLRGKFDYLSHTAIDPSTISRLAILTSHPTLGSKTQTTTP